MKSNVCFSGGATGADVAWGLAAIDSGHEVIHFSFKNHSAGTKFNLVVLSESDLVEATEPLRVASVSIKRGIPKPGYVRNLLLRNWHQIKLTERVYAVSSIDRMSASRSMVMDGTAWAIEMAIDLNVPEIFLFDQSRQQWFNWGCGFWHEIKMPPKPFGLWTGIGSRDLTEQGLQAIIDIFNQPN